MIRPFAIELINLPYISHSNQLETLTVTLSLQNTISNGTAKETLANIKTKAQQQCLSIKSALDT